MPMATIHKVGSGELYHIHFLDAGTDPGYGRPGGGPRPDHGLPGSPGHPDQGLPGMPPHVGGRPPGSGGGGIPDNELPGTRPPQIAPGYLLILARGTDGKWHYAALAPGSAGPKPLPEPPKPDQGPVNPDAPPAPDQTLPPIAAPV
jgi:hypothetical protein